MSLRFRWGNGAVEFSVPGQVSPVIPQILQQSFLAAYFLTVADYWALANNLAPLNNKNQKATVGDYTTFIDQLQKSGPSVRKLDQIPF
ncbi:MAG TPA: hypothetical protein VNO32_40030 [Candidatus Acidoferrum sp.]|nr:hypothetical protein [Candidatus Acidoferrum sp.]